MVLPKPPAPPGPPLSSDVLQLKLHWQQTAPWPGTSSCLLLQGVIHIPTPPPALSSKEPHLLPQLSG